MIRENMSLIETVIETEKLFMTDEKNALFLMINFENNE